jgi:hypothetical protein
MIKKFVSRKDAKPQRKAEITSQKKDGLREGI